MATAMRSMLLALAMVALLGQPATSAQDDPRLDRLFETLRGAANFTEAQRAERQIWQIWSESGDETVDRLMVEGGRAMATGDYPRALAAYDAVVEMAPDFAEGWNKRATLHFLMNDYPASIRDIDRTLALEPRHFGAMSGLSMILLNQGEEEQALGVLERAVRIHPHMPNAEARIRRLSQKFGRPI